MNIKEDNIFYRSESYDLIGIAFDVFNSMGYGYHERNYQKAYEIEINSRNISYQKEVKVDIYYKGVKISKYYLDFLINNRIIIELKVGNDFYHSHIRQVLSYLKSTNKKLGILILFSPQGIKSKRIVN